MTLQDRDHDPAADRRDAGAEHTPALGGTAESRAQEREEMAAVAGSPVAGALRLGALVALIVALGVWQGLPIVVVIVAILVMIFLHELGHYMAARWSGMKATEFFIGFGPRIWSFHRGETEYGIKAIPAGAYVKILGMSNLEEVDPADEARTYRQAPFHNRLLVAVAGSGMHFLVALVLLVVQFAFIGHPDGDRWQVGAITPSSAAAAAGVREGDRIVSFRGEPVADYDGFRSVIGDAEPGEAAIVVDRDGSETTLTADLSQRVKVIGTVGEDLDLIDNGAGVVVGRVVDGEKVAAAGLTEGAGVAEVNGRAISSLDDVAAAVAASEDGSVTITTDDGTAHQVDLGTAVASTEPAAFLGVGSSPVMVTDSIPTAVGSSVVEFGRIAGASVAGLGKVLWPPNLVSFLADTATGTEQQAADTPTPAEQSASAAERPVSIVGIVNLGSQATSEDWSNLVGFLIGLNIVLGVFNLFPLLPFDGGHVAIAVYEKAQELRLRQRRRYMADVSRMLPIAYGVIMVLGLLFVASMYLDVKSPVG